jgi:hypothetical protein
MAVMPGTTMWVELRPGAPWDSEGLRSAAAIAAFFQFEEARDARRRVCRTAITLALLAFAVETSFRIVGANSFATILTALATVAAAAVIMEWQAEKKLQALIHRG